MNLNWFIRQWRISVIARDGETIFLIPHLPVPENAQSGISKSLEFYFEKNFSDDKTDMVYWVLMAKVDLVQTE